MPFAFIVSWDKTTQMGKCFKIILFTLLLPLIAYNQRENRSTSIAETEDYQIEEITLPGKELGNSVNSIVQGPNGFLWFGSHGGLHRYDGHEFITYGPVAGDTLENTTSLTFPYVENLYWDHFDKLWVCTYGKGVYCFDPETEVFKHYQFDNNDPDSSKYKYLNHVMCAAEDAGGNLWFGTGDGLLRFDRKTERPEYFLYDTSKPGGLSGPNVNNIYLDKQGTLWISTGFYWDQFSSGGLNRYDPSTKSFISYTRDPTDPTSLWANPVREVLEDSRGNFWVATISGLQKMDRKTGRFKRMNYALDMPYAPGNDLTERPMTHSLMEDGDGGLWVGTVSDQIYPSHLLRYDPKDNVVQSFPITSRGWQLCQSSDGTIWVANSGHGGKRALKITRREKKYELTKGRFIFDEFKKTAIYRELYGGQAGEQWLGPLSFTFDPYNGTMWLKYAYDTRKSQKNVSYGILANYDKTTGETRFFHLKDLKLQRLNSAAYLGNLNVGHLHATGMAVGKDGKIWGSYPSDSVGIFCFDPTSGITQHFAQDTKKPDGLLSNYIVRLMMDSRGEVWTVHLDKGLDRFNPATGKHFHYTINSEEPFKIDGSSPLAIMELLDGKILTGGSTTDSGISPFITLIDPDANTTRQVQLPQNLVGTVRSFDQSEQKIAFIIYRSGIGIMSSDISKESLYFHNTEEDNFPIVGPGSIVFDKNGNLWVTSLDHLDFVCINIDKKKWFSFKSDNNDPILSRRGMLGPDGHVYFLNHNAGWTEIDPAIITFPWADSSEIRLTDLYILGKRQVPKHGGLLPKPIFQLDHLVLPFDVRVFGFQFSNFQFYSSGSSYQCRLYPYETEWKKLFGESRVSYSNVPAGTYRFQVRANTAYSLFSEKWVDFKVILHPPWWKTWWAYSLYALALFSFMVGLYYYQHRRWQIQTELKVEHEKALRLEELDHFKSRFYTNITHEFRTPLTVIKGMASQIGNEKLRSIIYRNSDRLLNMVNQLLDLSKLETNSLSINWVQADVIPYLKYLTESCHSLAENKNLNLAFFSKKETIVMDFDENKMQHILINLLSNAIKFTPAYGSVKVVTSQVFDNGAPFLELAVMDTGKGVPHENIPHIFDRFYQVDDSTTRQGDGSGIGLSLVKELVQLFGGYIKVESEIDKGSTFLVLLPIHQNAPLETMAGTTLLPTEIIEGLAISDQPAQFDEITADEKPLVLIIEDNADVTEYIVSCLQHAYSLLTARDGKEGVERALESIPDVILSDVMMPEMDGIEVCHRLKNNRLTSHIPIILLTAKATQEDKVIGLSQGADAYLTKPFNKEELLVRLANLAAQSKRFQEQLLNPSDANAQADELENKEAIFLQELNHIIDSNMDNELFNTNLLCRAIAMSRTQLHRKLKALTGQPTANYIRSEGGV